MIPEYEGWWEKDSRRREKKTRREKGNGDGKVTKMDTKGHKWQTTCLYSHHHQTYSPMSPCPLPFISSPTWHPINHLIIIPHKTTTATGPGSNANAKAGSQPDFWQDFPFPICLLWSSARKVQSGPLPVKLQRKRKEGETG